MSATVVTPGEAVQAPEPESSSVNYLNVSHTLRSWLLTGDHKRIAVLYLISVSFFFFLGSIAASLVRIELMSPNGLMMESETYNKMFSAHGIIMIFFFLIPSIPAIFGNFLIPIMIGARDLAFPRLNLASWYMYMVAGVLVLTSFLMGGVESGWTFYTPYSSLTTSQVTLCLIGLFIMGFSSIATGLNFIVTIHKMRAPGMTWDRLPLFVWAHYATSIIIILGTPVVAITLLLVVMERLFDIGVFNPANGGDPVLFQHMFWFYSHPAVYIMVLPGMGVISEVISNFSQKRTFGYHMIAYSSLAIALLGFLVWGHHMFVAGQSMYQGVVFSLLSFVLAVPSAIKVFNWTATIYKGQVRLQTPMVYALGFLGLFLIGGLTGLYLACLATDVHLTATYFIVAHFHYVMVGGAMVAFLGALHYWWPKMFGRMYPDSWGKMSALLVFVGFNLTFFPQFVMGYMGMPRRYHYYYFAPEFQPYHIASTLGSSVLAVGLILPALYLTWSLKYGKKVGPNPWNARGLEWETASPPIPTNFEEIPIVEREAYDFDHGPIDDTWDEESPVRAHEVKR
ncbi:MAG: cbb3-type cytochrome c oxidase subunit I [Methanoregulaceae archaeon]|nr:cbb3-type cytochrome c oxidase subunit I [Methanoregulaceae archaeon]